MSLESIEIRGQSSGPRLLIVAGVHGDEYEPMVAVRALASDLTGKLLLGTVTLVPIVNQPAYSLGARTADDQRDLARTCPGDSNGTITQRIAAELSLLIRSADYFVDLHTGGMRLKLLPLSGYMLHTDPAVLDKQRAMAEAFNLPIIWGTTPQLEGRSLSVARDANVPAIYAEHGGGTGFDPTAVEDYRRGCLNVMRSLGIIESAPLASAVVHRVEDGRPESGHLQICHPAPVDGVFMASVDLGQRVQQHEQIGRVFDPVGNDTVPVLAALNGIVLMLHVAPRVQKGTGLAVILPIP